MIRHCFAAAVLGLSLLTACAPSDDPVTIEVLGPWESPGEVGQFETVISAFENADRNVDVRYVGTRDVSQVLRARSERGSPPDIAVFPRLHDLRSYVDSGALRPLDGIPELAPERVIRIDHKAYGVSIAAHVKSLVWYAGAPRSWEALTLDETAMLAAGREPWCLGMSSPPLSGWPGTDWIEDLMLDSGVDVYDDWTAGRLPWTVGPVKEAWTAWKQRIAAGTLPAERIHPALLTRWDDAGLALFGRPPGCLLHHAASFNANNYGGNTVSVNPFPRAPGGGGTLISEDVLGVFRDSAAARAFVRFLGDPAQRAGHDAWRTASGGTHMVLGLDPVGGRGPNQGLFDGMLATGTLCRDASDQMPPAVTEAFQHAVMRFLQDPNRLDALLADLDAVAAATRDRWLVLPCFPAR
jgi:alpha-glucoside transport system substrate-binding protein